MGEREFYHFSIVAAVVAASLLLWMACLLCCDAVTVLIFLSRSHIDRATSPLCLHGLSNAVYSVNSLLKI